jgi:hypothetical protein
LDKDVPEDRVWNNPQMYIESQNGGYLNVRTMVLWAARAFFHALIAYSFTIWACYTAGTIDYGSISMITFTSVILINSVTVFLESR